MRLIEQARGGDRRAQQDLWIAHRRWVAAIVLAHRPRSVEVDDLMQEVALKLVDKIDTLRDASSFRAWLRQIIINICRGAGRSTKTSLSISPTEGNGQPALGTIPCPADSSESREVAMERDDLARRLLAQALTLPTEYREPLLLRCLNAMTYQQIGDLLDLPVTTIETRLARARRMLRAEMAEYEAWGNAP